MKINTKRLLVVIGVIVFTALVAYGFFSNFFTNQIKINSEKITILDDEVDTLSEELIQQAETKKAKEKAEAEAKAAAKAKAEAEAKKKAEEEAAAKATASTSYNSSSSSQKSSTPAQEPEPAPQLYYFYDPNCGTCMAQTPIVQEVASEGVPVVYMNVDATPAYISQYNITLVPTFILNGHRQSAFFFKAELLNFWNTYK